MCAAHVSRLYRRVTIYQKLKFWDFQSSTRYVIVQMAGKQGARE